MLAANSSVAEHHSYGTEVDMWSLGVILYVLLSAMPPFDDNDVEISKASLDHIRERVLKFDLPEFDEVSMVAKDLMAALMHVDPKKRLVIADAISHQWFKGFHYQGSSDNDVA